MNSGKKRMAKEPGGKYYTTQGGKVPRNIYELWEAGIPVGDSITPSGFSPEYVTHILSMIQDHLPLGRKIASLGSGNGFVEKHLADAGYDVLCIDVNEEATAITSRKGLRSVCMNFFELTGIDLQGVALIYADGFFGHLFQLDYFGLKNAANHIHRIEIQSGTLLLVSNDAPSIPGLDYEPHASVPDFWYLSPNYIENLFQSIGFGSLHLGTFEYLRPVSGIRTRSIYLGRATNTSARTAVADSAADYGE